MPGHGRDWIVVERQLTRPHISCRQPRLPKLVRAATLHVTCQSFVIW